MPSRTVLYDTFTSTSATPLPNHTPDITPPGSVWRVTNAFGDNPPATCIADGRVHPSGQTNAYFQWATIDSGIANGLVAADWTPGSGSGSFGGLALRANAGNDFLWVQWWGTTISVNEFKNQVLTSVASAPVADVTTGPHHVAARLSGLSITILWDGVTVLQVTDGFNSTATRHGFVWYGYYDWLSAFDNFAIFNFDISILPIPTTPTVVVYDSFSGSGTLSSHTPDIIRAPVPWRVSNALGLAPAAAIVNGTAEPSGQSSTYFLWATVDAGTAGGVVAVDWTAQGGANSVSGLVLRASDNGDALWLYSYQSTLTLARYQNGALTWIGGASPTNLLQGTHRIEAHLSGTTVE